MGTMPRVARPVDAAGLVLIRPGPGGPEVLLGRRHRRAKFLPGWYVFPGGRVDRIDAQPSGFEESLHPAVAAQLREGAARRSALAFARAAIRETFEEAGLLLATRASPAPAQDLRGPVWRAFATAGYAPAFEGLDFICRAITPTSSTYRYNTRFLLADGARATGVLEGNGELDDLQWWPQRELRRLPMVDVTAFVLAEAMRRWTSRLSVGAEPARLFCYRDGTSRWRPGRKAPWRAWTETLSTLA
jgi:8-oxo-dGTP pyrophosphatase MutT (NUDIX family)